MDDLCKGCLIYYTPKGEKCKGYIVKDMGCPCRHCLVKMMCDSPCESFKERLWTNFMNKFHDVKLENTMK